MFQKLKIKANVEIFFLFLLFILCDTATQIFLKKGATHLGEIPLDQISHVLLYVLNILTNGNIMMGVCFVLIAFFSWLAILSKVDLSKAQLINSLAAFTKKELKLIKIKIEKRMVFFILSTFFL